MLRRFWLASAVLISTSTVLGAEAEPESKGPDARLGCRREAAPGRVVCELELEVTEGRLSWADALVTSAPSFARPLRSRVAGSESSTPRRIRIELVLAATERGSGKISVLARSVACRSNSGGAEEQCDAYSREVSAMVVVGAESRPGG